ncbi:MAG: thiol peroxidase, partial [Calditrichae bacterium]|nr:thiol peroxidase [Calditrichia bacterium]
IGLDGQLKSISDFAGKTIIISAVPCLDTGVCDMETRRFNEIAGQLGDDVVILTISVDLPPAQKRWCGATGVDKVVLLSDHRTVSFGTNYGVLIKEWRQLARSVFIVDKKGILQYNQLVPDIAQQPDYDDVIAATKKLM